MFNKTHIIVNKTQNIGVLSHITEPTLNNNILWFPNEETLLNSEEYLKNLSKISNFRDSIIKIWQENQSEIPQFNFL